MKRTELKTAIRAADIVKIHNKSLNIYIQVNKTKLLESLDKEIAKDQTWNANTFRFQDMDGTITLFIN